MRSGTELSQFLRIFLPTPLLFLLFVFIFVQLIFRSSPNDSILLFTCVGGCQNVKKNSQI